MNLTEQRKYDGWVLSYLARRRYTPSNRANLRLPGSTSLHSVEYCLTLTEVFTHSIDIQRQSESRIVRDPETTAFDE
jgi:hypothetical protein